MEDRFLVQKSETPNHWVCTDKENKIVAIWEQGKFNETQKITTLENADPADFMKFAKILRELGDYLNENHPEKI